MKSINGYEGLYSITRDGKVWSYPKRYGNGNPMRNGRWMALNLNKSGYLTIGLSKDYKKKGFLINRLVALTFILNPYNLPEVNHKNGIKIDNRVENLEWCTHLENSKHAWKIGLFNNRNYKEKENPNVKLSLDQVIEIRKNHISIGIMKRKPWEKYNIGTSQYYNILRNEMWKKHN